MMSGIVLVIQPSFIFNHEKGDGYKEYFLVSSILLILSTILNSITFIILRHLRKIHVASLTASREIIFVIVTFLALSFANIDMHQTNTTEKLKILFFGIVGLAQIIMVIFAHKFEEAGPLALVDRSSAILISIVTQVLSVSEV